MRSDTTHSFTHRCVLLWISLYSTLWHASHEIISTVYMCLYCMKSNTPTSLVYLLSSTRATVWACPNRPVAMLLLIDENKKKKKRRARALYKFKWNEEHTQKRMHTWVNYYYYYHSYMNINTYITIYIYSLYSLMHKYIQIFLLAHAPRTRYLAHGQHNILCIWRDK